MANPSQLENVLGDSEDVSSNSRYSLTVKPVGYRNDALSSYNKGSSNEKQNSYRFPNWFKLLIITQACTVAYGISTILTHL